MVAQSLGELIIGAVMRMFPSTHSFILSTAVVLYILCVCVCVCVRACVCVCVCRLQQLDQHCQSSAQQVLELLARQNQLTQERHVLTEEMQNLRIQVELQNLHIQVEL